VERKSPRHQPGAFSFGRNNKGFPFKAIKFYHKVHPKCIHGKNKTAKPPTVERFLVVEHTGLELIRVCRLFGKKSINQGH